MPDLHWEDYEGEDGEKGLFVSTKTTKAHSVAEGLIGSALAQISASLGVLWEASLKDDHKRTAGLIEPTYHTVRFELEKALEILETIPRADLRPKHRDCRAVMKEASKRLASNSPLSGGPFDPGHFLRESVKVMESVHKCLLEQTKKKERVEVRRDYKRG